jgi:hypothetical protein
MKFFGDSLFELKAGNVLLYMLFIASIVSIASSEIQFQRLKSDLNPIFEKLINETMALNTTLKINPCLPECIEETQIKDSCGKLNKNNSFSLNLTADFTCSEAESPRLLIVG